MEILTAVISIMFFVFAGVTFFDKASWAYIEYTELGAEKKFAKNAVSILMTLLGCTYLLLTVLTHYDFHRMSYVVIAASIVITVIGTSLIKWRAVMGKQSINDKKDEKVENNIEVHTN